MLVVISHIGLHDTPQLIWMQYQEEIKTLPSERADESLTYGVSSGSFERGPELFYQAASGYLRKQLAILLVIVPNQIPWSSAPRRCLSQLLGHPGIGWVAGDGEVDDLPGFVSDDNEDVKGSEEQVIYDRKITRPYLMSMILEKRGPGLSRPSFPYLFDVLLDCWLPQLDAQFEQFSLDVFSTPGTVLQGHLLDEVDGGLGCGLGMLLWFRFPPPIPAEKVPVPPEKRVWLNDVQS